VPEPAPLEQDVPTAHGTVRVRRAAAAGEARRHLVSLDGRVLLEDAEHQAVSVAGAHPAAAPTLLLLALATGGSGRPMEFRVLELHEGGWRLSPPFGTGSDLAQAREHEGGLLVSLPRRCEREPAVWLYRGGVLAELTAPAAARLARPAQPTAFGEVEVAAGPGEHQAQLVLDPRGPGRGPGERQRLYIEEAFCDVRIVRAFPASRPRLLLVEIRPQVGAGSGPCPQYRLVELRPLGGHRRTEVFGQGLWPGDARYARGALELDLVDAEGALAEAWTYRGGRLTPRRPSGTSPVTPRPAPGRGRRPGPRRPRSPR
jgi:hypothetical protein